MVLLIAFLIAERLQRDRAMFDLSLFRKPTFTGGAVAAFALSGGLFALFLYMTLYLQDVLASRPSETGLRFLVLSGGILLTSTLAGRLTAVVPIRFLIAPGLIMVGVGLLLMRGITAETGWTHLVPGFIVAGAGTGFINPPAGLDCDRRRPSRARRHGVRDQFHFPPGGDRHRDCRSGRDLHPRGAHHDRGDAPRRFADQFGAGSPPGQQRGQWRRG